MITSPPWATAPTGPVGHPGGDGWWAAHPSRLAALAPTVPLAGLWADGRYRRVPLRFDRADFERLDDVEPDALFIGWGVWLAEIHVTTTTTAGAGWAERVHAHPGMVPARIGRRWRIPLRWRHRSAVKRCRRWQWTGRRWPPT